MRDAIIINIGYTTADIGILQHGSPHESDIAVIIGNIRISFRVPNVVLFGLGGRSTVRAKK